jgi:hypothetical protein
MYVLALQPHPSFFSNFLYILQLFFVYDRQCYHISKCVHRPCILQPSNLTPHFFLIFCIFYSYFSFMIANVTIFGNVCTDHVYITPQASSLIFFRFCGTFYNCFSSRIANNYKNPDCGKPSIFMGERQSSVLGLLKKSSRSGVINKFLCKLRELVTFQSSQGCMAVSIDTCTALVR